MITYRKMATYLVGAGCLMAMCMGLVFRLDKQEMQEAHQILEAIYHDISGYGIDDSEIRNMALAGADDTYGEITTAGAARLLDKLQLTEKDVFYDLGCGVGKFVLQVYMDTPVRKSVGIELSPTRIRGAQTAYKRFADRGLLQQGRELRFLRADITTTNLSDATVVFMASTCFSEALMSQMTDRLAGLAKGLRVATLVELPGAAEKGFTLIGSYNVPMSWDAAGNMVYVYRLG